MWIARVPPRGVRAHPAPHIGWIVAIRRVVVTCFGIELHSRKFIRRRAGVDVGCTLALERVVVGIITDVAAAIGHQARRTQVVAPIKARRAGGIHPSDAAAREEYVLVAGPRAWRVRNGITAGARPEVSATRIHHAFAVTVVGIRGGTRRLEPAGAIPRIAGHGVGSCVAGVIIGESRVANLIEFRDRLE